MYKGSGCSATTPGSTGMSTVEDAWWTTGQVLCRTVEQ